MHDFWKPYFSYSCLHGLCNARHLRELIFVQEQYPQDGAEHLGKCLLDIKDAVEQTRPTADHLQEHQLREFEQRYQRIIEHGYAQNPLPPLPPDAKKKRGRRKKTKPRNLLERLDQHRCEALAFMYDFRLPFDHNQAERDVRMVKRKQKISGTFRSQAGAQTFCSIRSYISTAHKNGQRIIDAISEAFAAHPFDPVPTTPE